MNSNQTGGTGNIQQIVVPRMNNGNIKFKAGDYKIKLGDFVTGQVYTYTVSPPSFNLYQIDEAVPATPNFFKFSTT